MGKDESELNFQKKISKYRKTMRTLNECTCVIETDDMDDSLDEIARIISRLKSGKMGTIRRQVTLHDDRKNPQVNLIAGLNNVGVARAHELLDMFGTPEKAFANLDEWISVNGITEKRLQTIRNIWSEEIPRELRVR